MCFNQRRDEERLIELQVGNNWTFLDCPVRALVAKFLEHGNTSLPTLAYRVKVPLRHCQIPFSSRYITPSLAML